MVDGQHSWNGSTEWGVVDSSIKAGYTYLAMLFTSFMSALLGDNLTLFCTNPIHSYSNHNYPNPNNPYIFYVGFAR